MNLQSYVCGAWQSGRDNGVAMRDATTGEVIAQASSAGIDFAAVLEHAREVGGPALRAMTFHERAGLLRAMAKHLSELKEEFYALSYRTGATKNDSLIDIDGGIGTVFVFAGKGSRELPNARVYVDGDVEVLSKTGGFVGQHIFVAREGAAVHINAFNFPVWGMLEKLAPTLLAGMPAIVKPATATAYLTELVVRRMIESKLLPEGALQLVCGSLGDLFDHLNCQDAVSFTGSAHTAARLRVHPTVIRHAVPFIAETDSLNSSILGLDATPGTPEFDLFVKEVVREMTVKAGQKAWPSARRWCRPASPAMWWLHCRGHCKRSSWATHLGRRLKPAKPGDRIKVRLTCARKSLRAEKGWGEVAWDTEITNQQQETVASYTVLTMVSIHAVPDSPGSTS